MNFGPDTTLPAAITTLLTSFQRRRRRLLMLRGLAEAVLIFLLGIAGLGVADYFFSLPFSWRLGGAYVCYTTSAIILAIRFVSGMWPRQSLRQLAEMVERKIPLDERLISAVDLALRPSDRVSAWMVARTMALAAQDASAIEVGALFDARPARQVWQRTLCVATVIAFGCLLPGIGSVLARAAYPYAAIGVDRGISIRVNPGNLTIPHGGACTIVADARPDPNHAVLQLEWSDGFRENISMAHDAEAGHFSHRLATVGRSFRYLVKADDSQSAMHWIDVAPSPILQEVNLRIKPPAYLPSPPLEIAGGDAEIIGGSEVTVEAHFAFKPVVSASLILDDGVERALILGENGMRGTAVLKPTANCSYRLRLVDADGLVSEPVQRWLLRLVRDVPPSASIERPSPSLVAGQYAKISVMCKADDDFGLRSWNLTVDDERAGHEKYPLVFSERSEVPRSASAECVVDLGELNVVAGDRLRLRLEVSDVGGQSTRSDPVDVYIVSDEGAALSDLADVMRSEASGMDESFNELRQFIRDWSALMRTFRPEDPDLGRAELASLQNRLASWCLAVTARAGRMQLASATGNSQLIMRVRFFSASLADWAKSEADMFDTACQRARERTQDDSALTRGRDLVESAYEEFQIYRSQAAFLTAACLAHHKSILADIALRRVQRSIDTAIASLAWRGISERCGLLPEFRIVEGWGTHFSGELFIPEAGNWTIECLTTGRVRARIDGKNLFASEGWVGHQVMPFRGQMQLESGWHDIELDIHHRMGTSRIELLAGTTEKIAVIPAHHLRFRAGATAETLAVMERLAPVPAPGFPTTPAELVAACAVLAHIPDDIAALAEMTGQVGLRRLADGQREQARYLSNLTANLTAAPDNWNGVQLTALAEPSKQLANMAKAARQYMLAGLGSPQQPIRAFSGMNRSVWRLSQLADQLEKLPSWLLESERVERTGRIVHTASALIEHLARLTAESKQGVSDLMNLFQTPISHRLPLLLQWLRLSRLGLELGDFDLTTDSKARTSPVDAIRQVATVINGAVAELDRLEAKLLTVQRASLTENERLLKMSSQDAKKLGRWDSAWEQERELSNLSAEKKSVESVFGVVPAGNPMSPIIAVHDHLTFLYQRFDHGTEDAVQALVRTDLMAGAQVLAIESEQQRTANSSSGYRGLAIELGRLAQSDQKIDPSDVQTIVTRIAALSSGKSTQAEDPAPTEAFIRRLVELSAAAEVAANKPDRRAKFIVELNEFLRAHPVSETSAAAVTSQLDELALRFARLAAERQQVFLQFARAHTKIAGELRELSGRLSAPLKIAAIAASDRCQAVADASAAEPTAVSVVSEALLSYDLSVGELARPCAIALAATQSDDSLRQIGPQLAALLSRQRSAAEQLDRILARHDLLRVRLASACAEGAVDEPALDSELSRRLAAAGDLQDAADQAMTRVLAVQTQEACEAAWSRQKRAIAEHLALAAEVHKDSALSERPALRSFVLDQLQRAARNARSLADCWRTMLVATNARQAEEVIPAVRLTAETLWPINSDALNREIERQRSAPAARARGPITDLASLVAAAAKDAVQFVDRLPHYSGGYLAAARRLREAAQQASVEILVPNVAVSGEVTPTSATVRPGVKPTGSGRLTILPTPVDEVREPSAMRESSIDQFDHEQQEAIRAYFTRLDGEP